MAVIVDGQGSLYHPVPFEKESEFKTSVVALSDLFDIGGQLVGFGAIGGAIGGVIVGLKLVDEREE
jgi:hypothetical protein